MRFAVFLVGFLLAATVGSTEPAWAMANISVDPAPDGTLMLVGTGWRPDQRLVIQLGGDVFPALADATGSFEIPTGRMLSDPPAVVIIRRADPTLFAALPELDVPNPFALLFAESLGTGARLFALSAGGLGLATLALRAIRAR